MTTTYIGPYLVIPPIQQTFRTKVRVCQKGCDAPITGKPLKFCGNCGGAILDDSAPESRVVPVSIFALADKWANYMHCPPYGQHHPNGHIWIPNFRGHGISISRGSEDSFVPVALTAIEGQQMLEKTQAFYADFVAALKEKFGFEPQWEVGVVVYNN